MNIPLSYLVDGQMRAALTNMKHELRYVLVDAEAGIAGSIYKRATDEVDFFSLTYSNVAEFDAAPEVVESFKYGIAAVNEEGDGLVFHQADEEGNNAYLPGTDRRLLPNEVPEEMLARFDGDGKEILDLPALFELDNKTTEAFEEHPEDVRQFKVKALGFHQIIQGLDKKYLLKEWVQRGLVHFLPQSHHNLVLDEYAFRVRKPDPYSEGGWTATISTVEEGKRVEYVYDVELAESRRLSEELPTDADLLGFENGIPMIGVFHEVQELDYRDQPYTKTVVVLRRAYEKGLRVAVQDLGSSGIRMPARLEKYHRPIGVTASKQAHIKYDDTYLIPFDDANAPTSSFHGHPFTLQIDDVIRLTKIFAADDVVEVTYVSMLDAPNVMPVRFESIKEYPGKDAEGRPHFVRKVAYVAAVRPLVNGKVVIE